MLFNRSVNKAARLLAEEIYDSACHELGRVPSVISEKTLRLVEKLINDKLENRRNRDHYYATEYAKRLMPAKSSPDANGSPDGAKQGE